MQTPSELHLPFDSWRPGQRLALRTIMAGLPHVAVTAPTGSGKSVIAGALPKLQPGVRHITLTATKGLQDQYTSVMPFLADLRGLANYPCKAAHSGGQFAHWYGRTERTTAEAGPCQLGEECELKPHGCDYYDARRRFIDAPAGVTNYATWLLNAAGEALGAVGRLICDEAHSLPEQLMNAAGVELPLALLPRSHRPRSLEGWRTWASQQLLALRPDRNSCRRRPKGDKKPKLIHDLERMLGMDETWAWEERGAVLRLEPTVPSTLMQQLRGIPQVVYLSATLTPELFTLLGIPAASVTFHSVEAQFAVSQRPIYFLPGSRPNYRNRHDVREQHKMVQSIDDFLEPRADRSGLVHSVSFDRAALIGRLSTEPHRLLVHRPSQTGADIYQQFLKSPRGTVLVSPSMMTGFDFPYDSARFQVLPKMPFPNQTEPIMQARMRHTLGYADHYTMQTFVQACGRIVRAADDWGETAVTDETGWWWYQQHQRLAPEWFHDAVTETRRYIPPLTGA